MGVRVKETKAETRMVTARVIANSRNRRPTMSPMKSSGISTAMSETVSERIVKPICSEPLSAARRGDSPSSKQTLDAIYNADDIRAGLALNVHQDGGLLVGPGCL